MPSPAESPWTRLLYLPWNTIQLRLARRKTGEEFAVYFKELGGLKPDDAVLDIGCGRGRMAVSLTRVLSKRARYEGFDILPASIDWCTNHVSRRHPNFRFIFSDVFNAEYNPGGKTRASEYVFPYQDASFDFVFLTSVFTHMLPGDLQHYLSEIARVTKKGGRCLASFFLLNPESLKLIEQGRSSQAFTHRIGDELTTNPLVPEAAVAYEETRIRKLFAEHSFRLLEPIHYGSWCGRKEHLSYQDIVVACQL